MRCLLKEGRAVVAERNPFTIRLAYETKYERKQRFILGEDPGRTNVGVAVISSKAEPLFLAHAQTRNKDVPKLMSARKEHRRRHRDEGRRDRRQRRAVKCGTAVEGGAIERLLPGCGKPIICRHIRNKEAKFSNRKRKPGWLTPTARQLLETHVSLVKKAQKYLPVTDAVAELNRFAFMALDNPGIRKWEFQKGQLYAKGSVREAVSEQQGGKCIFCGSAIEHYHHVVPKSRGGSGTLPNIAGLCAEHHDKVHKSAAWEERLAAKKSGMNKKYGALSVLNQAVPYLMEELGALFPGHAYATTGQDTKRFRDAHGIPKSHCLDAYCIAASVLECAGESGLAAKAGGTSVYRIRQFRRHDRQACHQENIDRKYADGTGRAVAVNRHKRTGQKHGSLEEYRQSHSDRDVSRLHARPHKPAMKRKNRIMPGAAMAEGKKVYVMQKSTGTTNGRPDYYVDTNGIRHSAGKSRLLKANEGLVFV